MTRYQVTTPQGPPVEGPRSQDAQDAELPRPGYVDRIEVDDGGAVTYATPGAWICHQMHCHVRRRQGAAVSPLTQEEVSSVEALRRLAETWPKSLWLYAACENLNVMRCGAHGERVPGDGAEGSPEGVHPGYVVAAIRIPCDGGDW